jgi:hypothetical protein
MNETQINLRGKELNPSVGEMVEILHEDKADHSGVASDQIWSPAFEEADIFAKFGHQSSVVLDEILHENICGTSITIVHLKQSRGTTFYANLMSQSENYREVGLSGARTNTGATRDHNEIKIITSNKRTTTL